MLKWICFFLAYGLESVVCEDREGLFELGVEFLHGVLAYGDEILLDDGEVEVVDGGHEGVVAEPEESDSEKDFEGEDFEQKALLDEFFLGFTAELSKFRFFFHYK